VTATKSSRKKRNVKDFALATRREGRNLFGTDATGKKKAHMTALTSEKGRPKRGRKKDANIAQIRREILWLG